MEIFSILHRVTEKCNPRQQTSLDYKNSTSKLLTENSNNFAKRFKIK